MPVPVSPKLGPGLTGGRSGSPVTLIMPPAACAIMSKASPVSYLLPVPNPWIWHVGAEPGERLGAGRARLELGEIDEPDTGETLEVLTVVTHRWSTLRHPKPSTIRSGFGNASPADN
jgi:hypothetical protein